MADWSYRDKVIKVREYTVPTREPWGADWNQVAQAMDLARADYKLLHKTEFVPDNGVRLHAGDDEIVIRLTLSEETGAFEIGKPPHVHNSGCPIPCFER